MPDSSWPEVGRGAPERLAIAFGPRAVAVLGASREPHSMSGTLLANLRRSFRGPIYPVNSRAKEVAGLPAYGSILETPRPVDVAYIAVPATQVLDAARQSIAAGVQVLVVITAGFAEVCEQGRERERELLQLARRAGVRIVGPNCMGVLSTDPQRGINGTFSLPEIPGGCVSVGTQSGALGFVMPDLMSCWQVGVDQLVSMGNKLDVGENDLLTLWESASRTRVIQLYLESFQDPREFRRLAEQVGQRKPIVLLKAGVTAVGARAAGSHTAACAAPNNAADALLMQSGVIRVATLEELFDVTALLAMQPLPAGPRVAILSNAGGPAVLAADMLAARGLQVPELSGALQARLRQFLPSEAVARNPIDLIGAIDARQFGECLGVLLGCDEVDSILSIYVPRLAGTTPQIVQAVRQVAAANVDDKPVVLVCMDAQFKPEAWRYADRQLPVYAYPERAAAALARAVAYVRWRNTPRMPAPALTAEQRRAVRAVIDRHASTLPQDGAWLPVADVWELVTAAGLPVPLQRQVSSATAAARFAEEVQGGVVLKAISPALLHKSDQGGVILGVVGPSAAHAAYEQLVRTVPDTTGIWAQEFVAGGSEWMLGVVHDEQFGHLIGFGLGGTLVEAVGQVQFRVQPLADCDARELVASHPASRLLDGCRTVAPADQDALQQAILRLSALLDVAPEIDEADFNPVIVLPEGQGVRFVDARVHLSRADLS